MFYNVFSPKSVIPRLEASGDELQVFAAFKNNLRGIVSIIHQFVFFSSVVIDLRIGILILLSLARVLSPNS